MSAAEVVPTAEVARAAEETIPVVDLRGNFEDATELPPSESRMSGSTNSAEVENILLRSLLLPNEVMD